MFRAIYGSICKTSQNIFFLNILTFRGPFQVIKSNKPSKIYIFWWNEAAEVIETTDFVEAVEVIETI